MKSNITEQTEFCEFLLTMSKMHTALEESDEKIYEELYIENADIDDIIKLKTKLDKLWEMIGIK